MVSIPLSSNESILNSLQTSEQEDGHQETSALALAANYGGKLRLRKRLRQSVRHRLLLLPADFGADCAMGNRREDIADELGLKADVVVKSRIATYVVEGLLGEGKFGAVFRVYDAASPNKKYALKAEKKIWSRDHGGLRMENHILQILFKQGSAGRSHFIPTIDRSSNEKFIFLVKQLVGQTLHDLKKQRPQRVFSMGTGIGTAIQCLEACQVLHAHGFIHRDLKPTNFAIGLGDSQRVVYILGFGLARRILDDGGTLKTPRIVVAFKGHVRYASLATHRNVEMSFKDDCESWFYLFVEFIRAGGLPWANHHHKDEVLWIKEDSYDDHANALIGKFTCKDELWRVFDYIVHLTYFDHIDYAYIYALLKLAARNSGVDLEAPYDWEQDRTK